MEPGILAALACAAPLAAGGLAAAFRSPRAIVRALCAGVAAAAVAGMWAVRPSLSGASAVSAGGWFMVDPLSAYHLAVMYLVFTLSSVFAVSYFDHEESAGLFPVASARRFALLWAGAMSAMSLVLVSNNLGIMWVGIEATTLCTAFLITVHRTPESLEAMWKYLLVCSVGVAFAFMGTLLVAVSAPRSGFDPAGAMLWTRLRDVSGSLDPVLVKTGFLFLVVGYGTKAGLAPMHTWLPDAHSQAPAPVSALFSGFMLNAALYCLARFMPLVDGATGHSGWCGGILVLFGLVSMGVAGAFIMFQRDAKRLLAYSSVEHLGIMAFGLGLGPLGIFGSLFHMLNHSLCKTVAFFSAGRLGQMRGSHDLGRLAGSARTSPAWGFGFMVAVLALVGVAPFSIFMSELQVLRAAIGGGGGWMAAAYLAALAVVFVGASRPALEVAWGGGVPAGAPPGGSRLPAMILVGGTLGLSLVLGLWMPGPLKALLTAAAAVLAGGR